jgi:hypothetical protein
MNDAKPKPSADETKLTTGCVEGDIAALLTGHWIQQMISVISRIGLPDHLGEEAREVADLARVLNVNVDSLFRICRALSKVGVLTVSGTRIGLTEAGRVLREDAAKSVKHVACFAGSPGPWKAWGELVRTLKEPAAAMKYAHGTGFWRYMEAHPEEARHFNRSMATISSAAMAAVLARYDFSYANVVCDVGGGAGSIVALLLEANPTQSGMVFDVPIVIDDARTFWKNSPLAARCSFVAGDFFESVPHGADVYVLKNVINNWDDARAQTILENCSAAMSDAAKLVLLESPLVDDAPPFPFLLDVHLMVLFGGRERTPKEYGALIAASGLELTQVVPTGGSLTVIEARKGARS